MKENGFINASTDDKKQPRKYSNVCTHIWDGLEDETVYLVTDLVGKRSVQQLTTDIQHGEMCW